MHWLILKDLGCNCNYIPLVFYLALSEPSKNSFIEKLYVEKKK